MNLIEQLGGYEKAKKIIDHQIDSEFQTEFFDVDGNYYANDYGKLLIYKNKQWVNFGAADIDIFSITDLENEAIQYRRQHNIFEQGDPVVSRCADKETRIFTYQETIGKNILVKCKKGKGYCYPKKWFSHADDEEIKAGKRLEVKSEN